MIPWWETLTPAEAKDLAAGMGLGCVIVLMLMIWVWRTS